MDRSKNLVSDSMILKDHLIFPYLPQRSLHKCDHVSSILPTAGELSAISQGGYDRICPSPYTTYFVAVNSSNPIGPVA